jgi:hypothetical protein
MIVWTAKDPAEIADYTWTPDLDPGDTIASFAASVTSGTVEIDSTEDTDTTGTLWLSGGADKELAMFSLTVTTAGGRTFREGAVLPIFDRATELLALFRLRYPAFATVSDGLISYRLFDALTEVGDNWPSAQRTNARLAWSAHKLAEAGSLGGAVPQGVTSFKSGTFSATVSDSVAGLTGMDATVYGREFVALRRVAFAGPRMAWTPPTALD